MEEDLFQRIQIEGEKTNCNVSDVVFVERESESEFCKNLDTENDDSDKEEKEEKRVSNDDGDDDLCSLTEDAESSGDDEDRNESDDTEEDENDDAKKTDETEMTNDAESKEDSLKVFIEKLNPAREYLITLLEDRHANAWLLLYIVVQYHFAVTYVLMIFICTTIACGVHA